MMWSFPFDLLRETAIARNLTHSIERCGGACHVCCEYCCDGLASTIGVRALALSPCCWPRRREFARSNTELRELARLMCLKASTHDTYTAWAEHLWGMIAASAAALPEGRSSSGGSRSSSTAIGSSTRQQLVIGMCRDREMLSEKNLVLTALKTQPLQPLPASTLGSHTNQAAHRRYAQSAGVGAWW